MSVDLEALRKESQKHLKEKRIPHVLGCEKEAVKLARLYGVDEEKAAVAGILHDVTKALTADEHIEIMKRYCELPDEEFLSQPKLFHALTGSIIAKEDFNQPEDICEAIRWHTTGKAGMTTLEKIIYLADYIEETRNFPGVEDLRAAVYRNLNEGMALGLEMSIEDIKSRGIEPYIETLRAYEFYKRKE